ncbi:16S rRNA (uracil(1498)-N(3))-methyltransferase [Candidatus Margulisiibacteriota bacterium]
MIPRIFVGFDKIENNNVAIIEGSDVNYIKNVLRLKIGDEITVLDSKSKEYASKIVSMEKNTIMAELIAEKHPKSEPKVKVTIAHGIPKNPKMELVVQKATELGALRIIPIKAERSVVKIQQDKEESKINRWQKIAKEAAEQSGRLIIPFVEEIMDFKDIFMHKKDYDLCIMLWEMEKERTLKKVLQDHKNLNHLLVLIGPEGGFSHDEAALAKKEGFLTTTLGNRIIRTETAAISALSMIHYEFDM